MQEHVHRSPFDIIRHTAEDGSDYWSARELYKTLGYTEWRNFHNVVIKRAMKACEENGHAVADHFVQSYKAIIGGKGAKQEVTDILLSRYAAYLVVERLGGTMPENLPTPEKSIQQLQREEQKHLEHRRQPSLFDKPANDDSPKA